MQSETCPKSLSKEHSSSTNTLKSKTLECHVQSSVSEGIKRGEKKKNYLKSETVNDTFPSQIPRLKKKIIE